MHALIGRAIDERVLNFLKSDPVR